MSRTSKLIAGLMLVGIPTIQMGGLFLLSQLLDPPGNYAGSIMQDYFRAGHAHAGVLTILGILAQPLVDQARLPRLMAWVARLGVPAAAMALSAAFFLLGYGQPVGKGVAYLGAALLAIGVVTLGIGLIRAAAFTQTPQTQR